MDARLGRRSGGRPDRRRAPRAGLGTAAGILYAAGDVGTKAAVSGGFHVWFVPALLACHGLAFVALQFGFQRGGALRTAGLATLWTNALPIVAGMVVFGEPLPGGVLGVCRVAAFVAVVVGAALLTRPGDDERHRPRATGHPRTHIAGGVAAAVGAARVRRCGARATTTTGRRLHARRRRPGRRHRLDGPDREPVRPVGPARRVPLSPAGLHGGQRYPVLYLLHGFWGEPSSFVLGLHFAQIADESIRDGDVRPFIAVMPPGGLPSGSKSERAKGEWAGPSEQFVVRTVVPWADAHLPTIADARARAIAGVSAGAYGAVDIALRHVGLFGTAESWEGYFQPFRDGPFEHASPATLVAHDPMLLARKEAASIRPTPLRFFLSTGGSHGAVKRSWTFDFERELRGLGITEPAVGAAARSPELRSEPAAGRTEVRRAVLAG